MECMYKPGDAVMVRPDLKDNTDYKMLSGESKGFKVTSGTLISTYIGNVLHIEDSSTTEMFYRAKDGPGAFTDEMLMPAKTFMCKSLL